MRPIWQEQDRKRRKRRADYESACGTASAYKRHLRRGEQVDDACRAAATAVARDWRRRKRRERRRGTWQDVALDYIETFEPVDIPTLVRMVSEVHDDAVPESVRRSVYRLRDAGLVESRRIGDRVVWQSS